MYESLKKIVQYTRRFGLALFTAIKKSYCDKFVLINEDPLLTRFCLNNFSVVASKAKPKRLTMYYFNFTFRTLVPTRLSDLFILFLFSSY